MPGTFLYFAYGSNMFTRRLTAPTPSAVDTRDEKRQSKLMAAMDDIQQRDGVANAVLCRHRRHPALGRSVIVEVSRILNRLEQPRYSQSKVMLDGSQPWGL
jgi:hypothetical protein